MIEMVRIIVLACMAKSMRGFRLEMESSSLIGVMMLTFGDQEWI